MGFQHGEIEDYRDRHRHKKQSLAGHGVQKDPKPYEIYEQPPRECRRIHTEDNEKFPAEEVILPRPKRAPKGPALRRAPRSNRSVRSL
jgi:hypothetical protein